MSTGIVTYIFLTLNVFQNEIYSLENGGSCILIVLLFSIWGCSRGLQ